MSDINSGFLGQILGLPPAETHDVRVEYDIEIPMPDGAILLADRYYPYGKDKRPLILVRSPYGRKGFFGIIYGRLFAERGFQVLIQSCRGTFGSGGTFDPFRQEKADGLATVEWMKKQSWFPGEFGTLGGSYLGYVQWAIAKDAGPELKAMAITFSCSDLGLHHYKGGSFTLEDALMWVYTNFTENRRVFELPPDKRLFELPPKPPPEVERALNHLPLSDLDKLTCGREIEFWQNLIRHSHDDEYWKPADHSETVSEVEAPVLLVGGWYDIFLPWQLRDYRSLRKAGRNPRLVIGPWTHAEGGFSPVVTCESINWLRFHLLGDGGNAPQSNVKLFVMGVNEWRNYSDWPPNGYRPSPWYLQPLGRLAPKLPPESNPDRYCYDPTDPTPAVGGPRLSPDSGPKDNRSLEARPDVLTYTSAPLERDFEIIGDVQAELYAKSNIKCTDFFVRLCDVHPSGESINICDGLISIRPNKPPLEKDGFIHVTINLWPTAYHFRSGHCIRVQVSSGAHPRYVRNTGSCEPLFSAAKLIAAQNEIYHDPLHPSAIILPAEEKFQIK